MHCLIPQRRFSELLSSIEEKVFRQRMPYSGALELTYRCNLNCCHCYCNLPSSHKKATEELKLEEIKNILDQITDAGCLWLLLTGGEPLLREDFFDIYSYAIRKGLLVEVFTNATLINEEIAKKLSDLPPLGIEITIYGSNPAVHDGITGVKGSFENTMDGIGWLKKYRLKFAFKTMVLSLNCKDLRNMQEIGKSLGVKFNFDTFICPRLDGDMQPVQYRIPLREMINFELNSVQSLESCGQLFEASRKIDPKDAGNCGAGVSAFNIDPYGFLSPCTMFRSFQYSLRKKTFYDAYERLISDFTDIRDSFIPRDCFSCRLLAICPRCAGWEEIESPGLGKKVDYICNYSLKLEETYLKKKEEQDAKKALSEA